jgi:hypothetical protein
MSNLSYNPSNIRGILNMSGFPTVRVHSNPILAFATDSEGHHFDFWVQDNRLWLEIDWDPYAELPENLQAKLYVELADYDNLEHAFQGLMDLYLESEREAAEND